MVKGTTSAGKFGREKLHIRCRRCGRRSYNVKKGRCSACGYGASSKIKTYSWKTRKVNRLNRLV
ncbi:MAG: 50S ribosomal protein L37e [Candidatus Bathyarchaeia archaeon]|nr:50S ribosomal protein L37e [Candidatus Bathyarchaeota archaeon]